MWTFIFHSASLALKKKKRASFRSRTGRKLLPLTPAGEPYSVLFPRRKLPNCPQYFYSHGKNSLLPSITNPFPSSKRQFQIKTLLPLPIEKSPFLSLPEREPVSSQLQTFSLPYRDHIPHSFRIPSSFAGERNSVPFLQDEKIQSSHNQKLHLSTKGENSHRTLSLF